MRKIAAGIAAASAAALAAGALEDLGEMIEEDLCHGGSVGRRGEEVEVESR